MSQNKQKTTTDLAIIRKNPELFPWGLVVKIHDIGPYTFVEHSLHIMDQFAFSIFVDNEYTHRYCDSLDAAIICAIAYKNKTDDLSTSYGYAKAACKLLNVKV
jgi:hypothetical protein